MEGYCIDDVSIATTGALPRVMELLTQFGMRIGGAAIEFIRTA